MIRFPLLARLQSWLGSPLVTFGANPAVSGSSLAAGTISFSSVGQTSLTVHCTVATGGTAPYTYQFQRSLDNSTWSNVGSASSSTSYADSGLTTGVLYYYRVAVTDSASHHATSAGAGTRTGKRRLRRWFPGLRPMGRIGP